MTIACYVRVSSSRQKNDSQRAEIQKWLEANGVDQKQVEWYAGKRSGGTTNRPEFDRLQADIFSGKAKTIILWKLDRLSRRLVDGVKILSYWADRGLKIVVVTQQRKIRKDKSEESNKFLKSKLSSANPTVRATVAEALARLGNKELAISLDTIKPLEKEVRSARQEMPAPPGTPRPWKDFVYSAFTSWALEWALVKSGLNTCSDFDGL